MIRKACLFITYASVTGPVRFDENGKTLPTDPDKRLETSINAAYHGDRRQDNRLGAPSFDPSSDDWPEEITIVDGPFGLDNVFYADEADMLDGAVVGFSYSNRDGRTLYVDIAD